jgi:hypothetical protein
MTHIDAAPECPLGRSPGRHTPRFACQAGMGLSCHAFQLLRVHTGNQRVSAPRAPETRAALRMRRCLSPNNPRPRSDCGAPLEQSCGVVSDGAPTAKTDVSIGSRLPHLTPNTHGNTKLCRQTSTAHTHHHRRRTARQPRQHAMAAISCTRRSRDKGANSPMPSRTAGTAASGIAQLICSASQCPITRPNTADSAQHHDTREIPHGCLVPRRQTADGTWTAAPVLNTLSRPGLASQGCASLAAVGSRTWLSSSCVRLETGSNWPTKEAMSNSR